MKKIAVSRIFLQNPQKVDLIIKLIVSEILPQLEDTKYFCSVGFLVPEEEHAKATSMAIEVIPVDESNWISYKQNMQRKINSMIAKRLKEFEAVLGETIIYTKYGVRPSD